MVSGTDAMGVLHMGFKYGYTLGFKIDVTDGFRS
jgi:hypothetical protein